MQNCKTNLFLLKCGFKKELNFFFRQNKRVSLTLFTQISLRRHIQTARNYKNKKLKCHHVAPLAILRAHFTGLCPYPVSSICVFESF